MKRLIFIFLSITACTNQAMHKFSREKWKAHNFELASFLKAQEEKKRIVQAKAASIQSLDENESKTAQKQETIKPLVLEDSSPKRYKVIIPNTDQFIMLDDNLIEHSKLLKSAFATDKSGDTIPLDKKWFKEITLFDVKVILEIIDRAQDKIAIQKELNKYIANKTPERVAALCGVASYMDIQPLVDATVARLRKELVHKWQDKKFINSLNELPLDIQRLITPDAIRTHEAYEYIAEALRGSKQIISRKRFDLRGEVNSVSFSPDGTKIASGSNGNGLQIRNAKTGDLIRTLANDEYIVSMSWSPDGTKIVFSSWLNIHIWDVETGVQLRELGGQSNRVTSVSWSPDGSKIASGTTNGIICISNAETGNLIHTLVGHNDWVQTVSWSPDSTKMVSSSRDGTVRIWKATKGYCIRVLYDYKKIDNKRTVSWSPDGSKIVSLSLLREISMWDAKTGNWIYTFRNDDWVESVSWSPDSTKIIFGSNDGEICILNGQTGSLIYTLMGHSDNIRAVNLSPDGTKIVSGSDDKTLRLWNVSPLLKEESAATALTIDQMLLFFQISDQLKSGFISKYFNINKSIMTQRDKKIFDRLPKLLKAALKDKTIVLTQANCCLLTTGVAATAFGIYKIGISKSVLIGLWSWYSYMSIKIIRDLNQITIRRQQLLEELRRRRLMGELKRFSAARL